jgi:putative lipoic acid-binding regulatory protein
LQKKILFILEDQKTQDFYKRLEDELALYTKWPAPYLYKFIVPTTPEKVTAIETIFENQNAKISFKTSSKGSYTSVSISLTLESPKAVIENYKAAATIKGVISL